MNHLFILLIILLILFIFAIYYKNTDRESFVPFTSSDTPEGSSSLYGWGIPDNDARQSIEIPYLKYSCDDNNNDDDES